MARYERKEIESAATEAAKRLGYCLRENQMRAIVQFCRGQDVFVSLPI